MTNAIPSQGTQLKRGDGATPSESFTAIAEISSDITGPNFALDPVDATSHDSPDGWDEFIGGKLSGGDVSCTVQFIPTNATHSYAAGVLKDMTDKTLRNWQLVFPDSGSTTWSFAALVTKFVPKAPVNGKLTADISLRISGQPTLA